MKSEKFKVFFAIATLFVVSCSNPYKAITVVQPKEGEKIELTPAFKDLSEGKLYKAKVEILKNYLSGLLMIKEVKGSNRVIFTSETGLKFFDFEFATDTFVIHHVMEQFDNKYVLKTLREDLGDIVFYDAKNQEVEMFRMGKDEELVKRRKDEDDYLYYFYEAEKLLKIERASDKKQKVIITFENYENDIPQLINIVHKDFKMNIELKYIKR